MKKIFLFLVILLFNIMFVSAEYSLDLKIDKQEYSVGGNLIFNVLLLEDGIPISKNVVVYFSDVLKKIEIERQVETNIENVLNIEDNFLSGFWNVEVGFFNKKAKRVFSVKEKESVEFSIESDKLIIKNNGNVLYTKEIQIMIGEELVKQRLNIGIGDFKEIRLVGKDDYYDIKVTDGVQTIIKQKVYLTGDVIGALDKNLVESSPLGGVREPGGEKFFSSSKLPVAFIFVGAVLGLGILLLIEKRMRKRK